MAAQHAICLLLFINLIYLSTQYTTAWSLRSPFQRAFRAISVRRRQRVAFPSDTNITEIHKYFMNLALKQAEKANSIDEVPIGAVAVRLLPHSNDNTTSFEILGRACNRVEATHDASAHAELLAMRQASGKLHNWRLLNVSLYSTLEPCPMCLAAAQAFRVSSIVYGAADLRLGAVETHMRLLDIVHPFHNVSNVVKNVQANQSVDLLQRFFRRRRRRRRKETKKNRTRKCAKHNISASRI